MSARPAPEFALAGDRRACDIDLIHRGTDDMPRLVDGLCAPCREPNLPKGVRH